MKREFYSLIILVLLCLSLGFTQARAEEGRFYHSASSLRAGIAGYGDTRALSWNPAGITGTDNPILAFSFFPAEQKIENVELLYPGIFAGAMATRVTFLQFDEKVINDFFPTEEILDVNYLDGELAYARGLTKNLEAGVNVYYATLEVNDERITKTGLDLGLLYHTPWHPLVMGLAVHDVISKVTSPVPVDLEYEPQIGLGAGLTLPTFEQQQVKVLLDWVESVQSSLAGFGALDVEYGLFGHYFVRGGYQFGQDFNDYDVGLGVRFAGITADYAYRTYERLGNYHSLRLSFNALEK